MSESRKRKRLSIADKLDILKKLDSGQKGVELSKTYGVSKQQVSDIKKDREKLMKYADNLETSSGLQRKSLKIAQDEKLEQAVYTWFTQERAKGVPISGPLLQEQAQRFNKKLNPEMQDDSFQATTGWLKRFKDRHGIRQLSVQGEALSAQTAEVAPYREKVKQLIEEEGLVDDQLYNADETGLYWKLLPSKTLAHGNEKAAPGYKKSKDRLTLLGCCNASGEHLLTPLVIGKSAKPRCFKHVNMNALPVIYTHQKSAWMDGKIFDMWFFEHFVPEVKAHLRKKGLPQKAVLFIDNCRPHGDLATPDGAIRCEFLPGNTTSVMQPLDQGVLEGWKRRYKKELLRTLLEIEEKEEASSLIDALKCITLKDAVYLIGDAWRGATSESIKRTFYKALLPRVDTDSQESRETVSSVITCSDDVTVTDMLESVSGERPADSELQEWITADNEIPTFEEMTEDDIVAQIVNPQVTEQEDDDSDDEEPESIPAHSEAAKCFDTCIRWLEAQPDTQAIQIIQLKNLANKKFYISKRKQQKITAFLGDRAFRDDSVQ